MDLTWGMGNEEMANTYTELLALGGLGELGTLVEKLHVFI